MIEDETSNPERGSEMRRVIILFMVVLYNVILLISLPVSARTWVIHADGSGDQPTIQAGINAAAHYDTILVEPGRYLEMIDFLGKKITVGSRFLIAGDPAWIDQTIIDCDDGYGSTVSFDHAEESLSLLIGLTITGGFGTHNGLPLGAGIYIHESSPTLLNLNIFENGSVGYDGIGGGIYISRGSPYIDQVRVIGNEAGYYCGGIVCEGEDCRPIIRNSVITGNLGGGGTALDVEAHAHLTLENVLITGNETNGYPASIFCAGESRLDMIDVTLTGNTGPIYLCSGGTIVMINSIIWENNTPEIYFDDFWSPVTLVACNSDMEGGYDGIVTNENGTIEWFGGNIDENPQFSDIGLGDYTLMSESPCIDAGSDYFEWGDRVLVNLDPEDYCGEAPDMGAFEFCPDPAAVDENRLGAESGLVAYPNPFNASTRLLFTLSQPGIVEIAIFDVGGRMVTRKSDRFPGSGTFSIDWNGTDLAGRYLGSGTYFVRLRNAGRIRTEELLILR